jgi:hypothetical protein
MAQFEETKEISGGKGNKISSPSCMFLHTPRESGGSSTLQSVTKYFSYKVNFDI